MQKIRQKKSLGQVFLHDVSIAEYIVEHAHLDKNDTVVEIGPGKGILTNLLAERAKKVYAIEKDKRLCLFLNRNLKKYQNLSVINADALTFNYDKIAQGFKVVANLPYNISVPVLLQLMENRKKITSAVIMLQKEVAERVTAEPGNKKYGKLTIAIRLFCESTLFFYVSKDAFMPVPKVDSAVIEIKMEKEPIVALKDEKTFFKIVHTAFSQRRKTLKNNLKGLHLPQELLNKIFIKSGIDPSRRPETLSIEEFARISNKISNYSGLQMN